MQIKNSKNGFTLIEIIVVIGIVVVLMTTVGGIMTSSFKVKNTGEVDGIILNESKILIESLRKNVFDAEPESITCPTTDIGSSISFITKTGGLTSLFCDEDTNKIASISASGTYQLINNDVIAQNCDNFVSCQTVGGQKVSEINFNIDIGITGGEAGEKYFQFTNKVVIR